MPSAGINIDTNVNAAFVADKLNAAKIFMFKFLTVDMYTINSPKHSSLV